MTQRDYSSVCAFIEENAEVETEFPSFENAINLRCIPLDLTEHSVSQNLKGQLTLVVLEVSQEFLSELSKADFDISLSSKSGRNKPIYLEVYHYEHSSDISDCTPCQLRFTKFPQYLQNRSGIFLSHNGIYSGRISLDVKMSDLNFQSTHEIKAIAVLGDIYLSDKLRPDLSLSRDNIKDLPCNIQSALSLSLSRALGANGSNINLISVNADSNHQILLSDIMEDDLIQDANMQNWKLEKIFTSSVGTISIVDIKAYIKNHGPISLNESEIDMAPYKNNFWKYCKRALLQCNLSMEVIFEKDEITVTINNVQHSIYEEGCKMFPPLFFIPYQNIDILKKNFLPLNQNHPFSIWLITNAIELSINYPAMLAALTKELSGYRTKETIDTCNGILERLRILDKKLAPPKALFLKISDFN